MFGKHWIKGRDNSTFLRASQVVPVVEKKKKKICLQMLEIQEMRVQSLSQEDPLE